ILHEIGGRRTEKPLQFDKILFKFTCTTPPPYPSPLEGEGWERGIINYYVCINNCLLFTIYCCIGRVAERFKATVLFASANPTSLKNRCRGIKLIKHSYMFWVVKTRSCIS